MAAARLAPALFALAMPLLAAPAAAAASAAATTTSLEEPAAARFAALALKCLHQEYPNHISHTLSADSDVRPPRELTPAFYGCYDWHSAVHAHWLLVRLIRLFPEAPFAHQARAAVSQSLTPANIEAEAGYQRGEGRTSFERPYGLAWLLQLAAELRRFDDADAQRWSATLRPLETEAASRLESWLPKLHYPIRIGEHDQTAFSFGLIWDWAAAAQDQRLRTLLQDAAQRFYLRDRDCPLAYEPSGEDFLSPCLAEADFVRRVLAPPAFAAWLKRFLPRIPAGQVQSASRARAPWLAPGVVTDRADPKLAHIDGLNLSRAWMLEGIARALPERDARRAALLAAAAEHAAASLPAVTGEHYEGGHWLGTYAVYLTSGAGMETAR